MNTEEKVAYLNAHKLMTYFCEYMFNQDLEIEQMIDQAIIESNKSLMILPDGKKGNALAIALEMQMYKVAKYIILKNKQLNVDLYFCALDDEYTYTANDIFNESIKDYYIDESENINKNINENTESIDIIKKLLLF